MRNLYHENFLLKGWKATLQNVSLAKLLLYGVLLLVVISPHSNIQLYSQFTSVAPATSLGGSRHSSMALAAAAFAQFTSREMCM